MAATNARALVYLKKNGDCLPSRVRAAAIVSRPVWRNVAGEYWPAACLSERADWLAMAFLHISSANERAWAERRLRKRPKHVRHLLRLLNLASSIFLRVWSCPGTMQLFVAKGMVFCFTICVVRFSVDSPL